MFVCQQGINTEFNGAQMRALCQLSTYDGKRSAVVLNVILSISSCKVRSIRWPIAYLGNFLYIPMFSVLLSHCTVFNKELLYCTRYSQVRVASSISNYVTLKQLDVLIKFCMMIEFNFHIARNLQQGQYNVNILNHGDINS